MRLLHTSDWHLGKNLEGHSRLPEQEIFLEELATMADTHQADCILIAGDIYDSYNPPAKAEQLFYHYAKVLSRGGARPVIVIAGNHDNPDRLSAAFGMALDTGVILMGSPLATVPLTKTKTYAITESGPGYLALEIRGETLVVGCAPYLSARYTNQVFHSQTREADMSQDYSRLMGEHLKGLASHFREDTVNVLMGHFYIHGGETSGTERDIQLGGAYAVSPQDIPCFKGYIAMGHLHRPQKIPGLQGRGFYSGSPLQYGKSEMGYAKSCLLVDILPGEEPAVEKAFFSCQKPIEEWKCASVEEAIALCEKNGDRVCFPYLTIYTDRPLLQHEIQELYRLYPNIVELNIEIQFQDGTTSIPENEDKTIQEEFSHFYRERKGAAPPEDILNLFTRLLVAEGGDTDAAHNSGD